MLIREAIDIFDHFWDKYRDEGIEDVEKVRHLNTAMSRLVKREFDKTFEISSTVADKFKELIHQEVFRLDKRGRLRYYDIKQEYPDDIIRDLDGNILSTMKPEIVGVVLMKRWSGKSFEVAEFERLNDNIRITRDPFETPSNDYPKFHIKQNFYEVHPIGAVDVELSTMRFPIHAYLAPNSADDINIELSYSLSLDVIQEALRYAGINTKDRELIQYSMNENKIEK